MSDWHAALVRDLPEGPPPDPHERTVRCASLSAIAKQVLDADGLETLAAMALCNARAARAAAAAVEEARRA